jgi:hypothetical protein
VLEDRKEIVMKSDITPKADTEVVRGAERRSCTPVCLLGLVTLIWVLRVSGQGPRKDETLLPTEHSQAIVEVWLERLAKIEERILEGRSRRALRDAKELTARMIEQIESGEGAGTLVGFVSVLRALAAVNVGDETQALWHWHVGLQMYPELADYDLSAYGDAGQFLRDHPLRTDREETLDAVQVPGAKPPRNKKTPAPKFPAAKRNDFDRLSVVVQVVIDEDGNVSEPQILPWRTDLGVGRSRSSKSMEVRARETKR